VIAGAEFWPAATTPTRIGTLNVALAGATVAATGALNIKGTVTATLAGATVAATGTLPLTPISGTVTATLADATLSAKAIHQSVSPTTAIISENTQGGYIGGFVGVIDTTAFSSSPTTNFGANFELYFSNDSVAGYFGNYFLRFAGLSNLPVGRDVVTTELRLTGYTNDTAGTQRVSAYRLLRNWTQGGLTWDTYDGTNAWTTPGALGSGDIDPEPVFVADIPHLAFGVEWLLGNSNLNKTVEGWINGTFANYGLMLRVENDTPGDRAIFAVEGAPGNGYGPALVVTYQTPFAGSASASGTLSATLADATVTSAAKLNIAATVASTLAGATVASTGALIGKLNAAQTLPAFGQTATASAAAAPAAITAAQTLPAFSQAATVVSRAGLTAAQTLPTFSQTATAAAIASLNAAQTLPAFGQTANAALIAAGSAVINAAQTLPAFSQTATATVRVTVTGAQTLPAFGQTATAAARVAATAAQTLPAFGQTATATVPAVAARVATASQTLPAFGQTASAVSKIVLSAVQAMPAFTQFASMQNGAALFFVANERTYTLGAEQRTYAPSAESRRTTLSAEQRSFAPDAESRRAMPNAEDRRHLTPAVNHTNFVN
jgi:hypothetical protein